MTAPLDLRAVEARLNDLYHETGTPGAIIDVEALLSHCRALRAALRRYDAAYHACTFDAQGELHGWGKLQDCSNEAVAVLAAARDGPA